MTWDVEDMGSIHSGNLTKIQVYSKKTTIKIDQKNFKLIIEFDMLKDVADAVKFEIKSKRFMKPEISDDIDYDFVIKNPLQRLVFDDSFNEFMDKLTKK